MNTCNEILGILYCIQGSPIHPFSESYQENADKAESTYSGLEIEILYQAFKILLTNHNYDQQKSSVDFNINNPFSTLKKAIEIRTVAGLETGTGVHRGLEQVLSSRELQIANLIKAGNTNKEIAQILNLSVRTIEAHRYKMRDKVGLKNNRRTKLRNQLIFIPESYES